MANKGEGKCYQWMIHEPSVRDIFLGRTYGRVSKIKYFTPEEDAKIKEGISRGYNFRQVGEFVGRSTLAVSNRAYRMGLKSGQPVQKTMP